MKKVMVVYWSQTGNTEKMAQAIAEGAKDAGAEVELKNVSEVSASDLESLEGYALGCPAMGAEVLEEEEFEPFMCEVEKFSGGKKVAIFGSYGWGDGQWMRDWEERINDCGATLVGGEGLMLNEEPDDDGIEKCKDLGAELARL